MREISPRRQEYLPVSGDTGAEFVYSPASEEPHLRDYMKMLRKRRRLVILVVGVMLGLGVLFTAWSPSLYTAIVTLKIDSSSPSVTAPGGEFSNDYYQTQVTLLKSRPLAA